MKPMLAATKQPDRAKLVFPLYASPKIDGIRGLIVNSKLRSRKLKPIPNKFVTLMLSRPEFDGRDGEITVGMPTAADVFRKTDAALSSIEGQPRFTYWIFDRHDMPESAYEWRLEHIDCGSKFNDSWVCVTTLPQLLVHNLKDLETYEKKTLERGYEGLILRDPWASYKFGRSTLKQGWMLKLKPIEHSEGLVLEVLEEMQNNNEAKRNEVGELKRSSHKANKLGKGIAGALRLKDLKTGQIFKCGGLTAKMKKDFWKYRADMVRDKMVARYHFQPVGVKDKPRFPEFDGFRQRWDF